MSGGAKTAVLIVSVAFAAAIGCGIGCAIAMKWSQGHETEQTGDSHTADDHLALHKKLHLRDDQKPKMDALEEKFAEQIAELRKPIFEANAELADALVEDKAHSERVKAAVDKIHHAQAVLQKATIEHIIEMRTVLDEDQFDEFLEVTAESLRKH